METEKRKLAGKERTSSEVIKDRPKLMKLHEACIRSARQLIDEAKILERHERYARAFFLGIIANEEIGKAELIADYAHERVSRKEFQLAFRDHSVKNAYVSRTLTWDINDDGSIEGIIAYDLTEGKDASKRRERALYVSYGDRYVPLLPENEITKQDCRKTLYAAEVSIQIMRGLAVMTGRF